jgi:hypothetical protein
MEEEEQEPLGEWKNSWGHENFSVFNSVKQKPSDVSWENGLFQSP